MSRRWLVVGAAVAILAAVSAALIGRQILSGAAPSTQPRPSATVPAPSAGTQSPAIPPQALAPVPGGFMRLQDVARGLSISLPTSWHRLPSADAQISVLATGDGASMLMRAAPLGIDVGPDSIGPARRITDNLVRAAKQLAIVQGAKRVSVGGLPGYLYLYTYQDPATGQRGGHAHYFIFRHQTLITIVFQVLPADRFASLAPLFDQIGRTLRSSNLPAVPSLVSPSPAATAR